MAPDPPHASSAVAPQDEAPHPSADEGFGDAVTVAFGDPASGLYGLARAGRLTGDPDTASGLAVLFAGGTPVAAGAEGGVPVSGDGWEGARAGGVTTAVTEPLRRWTVRFDGGDAGGFELELEARSAPAVLGPAQPAATAGGMQGYEQLCAVRGEVRAAGRRHRVECLGQRGHTWGRPDWGRIDRARTLSAWFDEGTGFTATAIRPSGKRDHAAEAVVAHLVLGGEPVAVADPRISTTLDADGRQRHAGLELWLGEEDDWPRRGAGQVLCGTTLDLGRLRMDCAFFEWWMEGRRGVGRYDVVRPADR